MAKSRTIELDFKFGMLKMQSGDIQL